jgi:hypothetical protein
LDFGATALGLGASQVVHLLVAVAGFARKHSPQVHPPPDAAEGCFRPAAAQLNDEAGFGAAAPGLGASQVVHLVVAVAGFARKHSPQVHPPPDAAEGCFKPAAAQLNDEAGFGVAAPGLGASQVLHLVVAVAGFARKHSPQVHSPSDEAEGCFKPAAAQLNDEAGFGGAAPGLGASQIVHLVVAVGGLAKKHPLQVHSPPDGPDGRFKPAVAQSNDEADFEGSAALLTQVKLYVGREALEVALAASIAPTFPENKGKVKVKIGSDVSGKLLALSLAFFWVGMDERTSSVVKVTFLSCDTAGTVMATSDVTTGWTAGFDASSSALGSGAGDAGEEEGSG